MADDWNYMKQALAEADKAASLGEIPVGAAVVAGDGTVLALAHNLRETERCATAHAELLAIEESCRKRGSWRLSDCTVYVTLEPCPMCMGAIINARIGRVVFGAKNPRAGACGSLVDLASFPLEVSPKTDSGIGAEESLAKLRSFFQSKRTES